jgi:hypothetical protein
MNKSILLLNHSSSKSHPCSLRFMKLPPVRCMEWTVTKAVSSLTVSHLQSPRIKRFLPLLIQLQIKLYLKHPFPRLTPLILLLLVIIASRQYTTVGSINNVCRSTFDHNQLSRLRSTSKGKESITDSQRLGLWLWSGGVILFALAKELWRLRMLRVPIDLHSIDFKKPFKETMH